MQNYRDYEHNVIGTDGWPIVRAIADFMTKCTGMSSFGVYFQTIGKRIQDFHVRQNEHFSTYWYTTFRNGQNVQALRTLNDSEGEAMRYVLHGKTILHIMRSLCGQPLIPNYSILDKIKIECGLTKSLADLAMRYRIINQLVNHLQLQDEYSPAHVLEFCAGGGAFGKYVLDMVRAMRKARHFLRYLMNSYDNHDLILCYAPFY